MAKQAALAICALIVSTFASAAFAAPSPNGNWEIISDKDNKPIVVIQLTTAGGQLQGVLTQSLRGADPKELCAPCKGAFHNKQIIGMRVLWGLKATSDPLTWDGGQILDPDSGNIYSAKLTESADGRTITMRGFIGISLIGRTQTWHRQ